MSKITEHAINIIDEYTSGKGCRTLARQYNIDAMTIYRFLIGRGVKLRNKTEGRTMNLPNTALSDVHRQIIEGCLLGDGSVLRSHNASTAHFSLKSVEKYCIDHLRAVIPLPHMRITMSDRQFTTIHGKQYKCRKSYNLISTCDKSLNEFRDTWYPEGKKIVPDNLILHPTTIRHWFYGDGSTSYIPYKNTKDAYVRISFCTNGFTVGDCEKLVSKLNDVGLSFHIYLSRKQPMLVALKCSTVHDFFNYIGSCDVPCFAYKWKLPSSEMNRRAAIRSCNSTQCMLDHTSM